MMLILKEEYSPLSLIEIVWLTYTVFNSIPVSIRSVKTNIDKCRVSLVMEGVSKIIYLGNLWSHTADTENCCPGSFVSYMYACVFEILLHKSGYTDSMHPIVTRFHRLKVKRDKT